jgi:hypothetical protein
MSELDASHSTPVRLHLHTETNTGPVTTGLPPTDPNHVTTPTLNTIPISHGVVESDVHISSNHAPHEAEMKSSQGHGLLNSVSPPWTPVKGNGNGNALIPFPITSVTAAPTPIHSSSPAPLHDTDMSILQVKRTDDRLGRRQLYAMLRKNVIIKRRAWCQTLCECIAPLLLTFLILIGWQLSSKSASTTPPTIYVNQTLDLNGVLSNSQALVGLLNLGGININSIVNGGGLTPGISPPTADPSSNSGGLTGGTIGSLIRNFTSYAGPLPVPSLDTFIAAHNLLHSYLLSGNDSSTLEAVNRLSIADARFNVLVNLGKLSFAPDTPQVRSIVSSLNKSHTSFAGAFDGIYPSETAAINYALRDFTLDKNFEQRDPYRLRSWAVIVFDQLDFQHGIIDYSIRMNYSVIPSTKQLQKKFQRGYDGSYQRYFLSGYMTLQMSIEQALVDVIGSASLFASNYSPVNSSAIRGDFGSLLTAPFPVQSSFSNPFYDSSGPFVGLVLCMSLLYPVSRLIKVLVEDKENRSKETLKVSRMWLPFIHCIQWHTDHTLAVSG